MATYETIGYNSPDGAIICRTATDKVAFYGAVPVVQRPYSSAVHCTSALASSADFGATQLAAVVEIQKTLVGLGVWATA
jgi:hypothetical protein